MNPASIANPPAALPTTPERCGVPCAPPAAAPGERGAALRPGPGALPCRSIRAPGSGTGSSPGCVQVDGRPPAGQGQGAGRGAGADRGAAAGADRGRRSRAAAAGGGAPGSRAAGHQQARRPGGAPGRGQRGPHAAERAARARPQARPGAARRPHPPPRQGHQRPAGRRAHARGAHRAGRGHGRARDHARVPGLCIGVMTAGGTVDEPIGRHRTQRTRMAVRADGRPSVTHYRVLKRFRGHTLLRVQLETGRTHQIRVHLAHVGFPVVGDPVYGGRRRLVANCTPRLEQRCAASRARRCTPRALKLIHPTTGRELQWEAPLPEDMQQLLAALEADRA